MFKLKIEQIHIETKMNCTMLDAVQKKKLKFVATFNNRKNQTTIHTEIKAQPLARHK